MQRDARLALWRPIRTGRLQTACSTTTQKKHRRIDSSSGSSASTISRKYGQFRRWTGCDLDGTIKVEMRFFDRA
jgi:hypothetical protein